MASRPRVVLVTGGGKGVGRGISERFASQGWTVVICGRHPVESSFDFITADVRDYDSVGSLVDTVIGRHGSLDAVINNAGGSPPADSATAPASFSTKIVALNLLGPLFVAQHAHRVMGSGLIVNIGSLSGLRPSPQTAAYGAAKAGLLNLTQTLAMEWAPRIRVNMVTAGLVKTEQAELFYGSGEAIARVEAGVPMGRMALPADIGDACLLLASPLAATITGANLVVHGGGERPPFWGEAGGSDG